MIGFSICWFLKTLIIASWTSFHVIHIILPQSFPLLQNWHARIYAPIPPWTSREFPVLANLWQRVLQHTHLYTPFLLICTFMVKLRSWIAAYRTCIFKSFYRTAQFSLEWLQMQPPDSNVIGQLYRTLDEVWPLSISNWFFPPQCFFKCTLLILEMTLLDRIVYCPHLHTTESLWYTQFFFFNSHNQSMRRVLIIFI